MSQKGEIFRGVVIGLIVTGVTALVSALVTLLMNPDTVQKILSPPPHHDGKEAGKDRTEAPVPQLSPSTKGKGKSPVPELPKATEAARKLNELKSLVNDVKIDSSKQNVALVIDSIPTRSGLSPKMKLHGLFKDSTVNIIGNLFKEEQFIRSGLFREIYEGNTDLLKESGVLRRIDFLLVGKLSYSFRKSGILDSDLISCEMNFAYKIISNVGDVVRSDNLRQTGAGFTEDGALESGLEKLSVQRPKQLFEKGRG